MNPAELSIQRKNTWQFILADKIVISMFRPTRERTGSGGSKRIKPDEPNVPEQTMRLIPINGDPEQIKTSTGRLIVPAFTLLAKHDADLQQWDMFLLNDVWFEVSSPVRPEYTVESRYESKATVARREDV